MVGDEFEHIKHVTTASTYEGVSAANTWISNAEGCSRSCRCCGTHRGVDGALLLGLDCQCDVCLTVVVLFHPAVWRICI